MTSAWANTTYRCGQFQFHSLLKIIVYLRFAIRRLVLALPCSGWLFPWEAATGMCLWFSIHLICPCTNLNANNSHCQQQDAANTDEYTSRWGDIRSNVTSSWIAVSLIPLTDVTVWIASGISRCWPTAARSGGREFCEREMCSLILHVWDAFKLALVVIRLFVIIKNQIATLTAWIG